MNMIGLKDLLSLLSFLPVIMHVTTLILKKCKVQEQFQDWLSGPDSREILWYVEKLKNFICGDLIIPD